MPKTIWKAPTEVQQLLEAVKKKHHSPRLDDCFVAICFEDSGAFVGAELRLKLEPFGLVDGLLR